MWYLVWYVGKRAGKLERLSLVFVCHACSCEFFFSGGEPPSRPTTRGVGAEGDGGLGRLGVRREIEGQEITEISWVQKEASLVSWEQVLVKLVLPRAGWMPTTRVPDDTGRCSGGARALLCRRRVCGCFCRNDLDGQGVVIKSRGKAFLL